MSILDKIKAIFKKKPSAEATEPMEEDSGIGQEEAPVLPTQGEGLEPEPEPEPEAEPKTEKEGKPEEPAATADEESPLAEAIAFAEAKLAEKKDELTPAELEMFKAKLSSYADKVGKDEEDALVSVSQLIGAIAQAKPPQKKPEAEPEPAEPKKKSTAKKKAPANKKSTAKKKAPANK